MSRTLLTVRQFAEKHPAFTIGGLRWQIFHEKQNGLAASGAILRVGNKVLVDEARFFAWVDASNGVGHLADAA
jgi:hypothetical protein